MTKKMESFVIVFMEMKWKFRRIFEEQLRMPNGTGPGAPKESVSPLSFLHQPQMMHGNLSYVSKKHYHFLVMRRWKVR